MEKIPISIQLREDLANQVINKAEELDMTVTAFIEQSLYKDLKDGVESDTFTLIEHISKLHEQKMVLVNSINSLAKSLHNL